MPRTTWQDLARQPVDGGVAAASASNGPDPRDTAATGVAGDADADISAARRAAPGSLAEVPELQGLLAERDRLQQALARLTGHAPSTDAAPNADRDARRFPPYRADAAPRDGSRMSLREVAEARAMDIDPPAAERDPSRPRTAAERAERARQVGEAQRRESQAAWERHRERLVAARDLARSIARGARSLGMPGMDLPDAGVARRAEALSQRLDSVPRHIDAAGTALRSLEAGSRALSGMDLRRDGPAALEQIGRQVRRVAEDALRDTAAGRRLSALTNDLAPPALRDLPGEGLRAAAEVFEDRRDRALQALRERRTEAAAAADRPRAAARASTEAPQR